MVGELIQTQNKKFQRRTELPLVRKRSIPLPIHGHVSLLKPLTLSQVAGEMHLKKNRKRLPGVTNNSHQLRASLLTPGVLPIIPRLNLQMVGGVQQRRQRLNRLKVDGAPLILRTNPQETLGAKKVQELQR